MEREAAVLEADRPPNSGDVLKIFARLEADGATGRNPHLFTGSGVAPDAALARLHLEDTEAAQLDALEQALFDRKPTQGLVHHSDRGTQYVSIRYTERLAEAGVEPSVQ